jgi:DNA-binding protein H-NS
VEIDHLSASQIRKLQAELTKKLVEQEQTERLALVDQIRGIVADSGYDLSEIVRLLTRTISSDGAKYVNPSDQTQTWAGLGRRPIWLSDLEKEGRQISEFLVR